MTGTSSADAHSADKKKENDRKENTAHPDADPSQAKKKPKAGKKNSSANVQGSFQKEDAASQNQQTPAADRISETAKVRRVDARKARAAFFTAFFMALLTVITLIVLIGVARPKPVNYRNLAASLDILSERITDVSTAVSSATSAATSLTTGDDTLFSAVTDAADKLEEANKEPAGSQIFVRDDKAQEMWSNYNDKAVKYQNAASGFVWLGTRIIATETTCSGENATLETGDNVAFLKDYGTYLDDCTTALDTLDESLTVAKEQASTNGESTSPSPAASATEASDTPDMPNTAAMAYYSDAIDTCQTWSKNVRNYIASQRTKLSAVQEYGSTTSMNPVSDAYNMYLARLTDLSSGKMPALATTMDALSKPLSTLDPSRALHDLQLYLYMKSSGQSD